MDEKSERPEPLRQLVDSTHLGKIIPRQPVNNLQAYIDESIKDGNFVLAGHVASSEAWDALAKDWKALLPTHGVRGKKGKYHFKMSAMTQFRETRKNVPAFFEIIQKHVLYSVSCHVNENALKRAMARVWVENLDIDWDRFNNPYFFAFRGLLDTFHANKHLLDEYLSENPKVDFIFDDRHERKVIEAMWDEYILGRPMETRSLYGGRPVFHNDDEFPQLQAADFWAWWIRKWIEDDVIDHMLERHGRWPWPTARKVFPRVHITIDENEAVRNFLATLTQVPLDGRYLCDLRYPRDQRYARGGMSRVHFRGLPRPRWTVMR
jgi:hypothetical protein